MSNRYRYILVIASGPADARKVSTEENPVLKKRP